MLINQVLLCSLWYIIPVDSSRPIIGILAQEPSPAIKKLYPYAQNYIAASYVKAVEASGARVVPILPGAPDSYYGRIIHNINGLIFPGGNTWFYNKGGYADAGDILFNKAKQLNDAGLDFPILGICLGFELLLFLDVGRQEYREGCSLKRTSLPLEFKPNFRNSLIYRDLPAELEKILTYEPVTYNQHIFCVSEKNMTKFNLTDKWTILTTNNEPGTNLTFVSTIESTTYPFVGVQFHPEKNSYEWRKDLNVPHSKGAIEVGRYFFDWLISEARKNNNSFENLYTEYQMLIDNTPAVFTKGALTFDELYLFSNSDMFLYSDAASKCSMSYFHHSLIYCLVIFSLYSFLILK